MLVWINGPFGIGKTATACALREVAHRRDRGARIYDPEILGCVLQRIIPAAWRPRDFRAQASWRWLTRGAVAAGRLGLGLWIVPMTIDDPQLLETLTGGRLDRVVQLTAPRSVVEHRIRRRQVATAWCLEHLERWPADPALGRPIDTHERTPEEVAEAILTALG